MFRSWNVVPLCWPNSCGDDMSQSLVHIEEFDPDILGFVRRLAKDGTSPSGILRELLGRLNPSSPQSVPLFAYFREAFQLSFSQASPIFGWLGASLNELDDADIDRLLGPAIESTRVQRNCEVETPTSEGNHADESTSQG